MANRPGFAQTRVSDLLGDAADDDLERSLPARDWTFGRELARDELRTRGEDQSFIAQVVTIVSLSLTNPRCQRI